MRAPMFFILPSGGCCIRAELIAPRHGSIVLVEIWSRIIKLQ